LYGRELRFPNELMYVEVKDKNLDAGSYSDFVEGQRDAFRTSFVLAMESLGFCAENPKKRYYMRVRLAIYKVGNWVYYFVLDTGWDSQISEMAKLLFRAIFDCRGSGSS